MVISGMYFLFFSVLSLYDIDMVSFFVFAISSLITFWQDLTGGIKAFALFLIFISIITRL